MQVSTYKLWKHFMNMSNGIIGVCILAMPYCFAQVGNFIILYAKHLDTTSTIS
jgi:hypothetical protein